MMEAAIDDLGLVNAACKSSVLWSALSMIGICNIQTSSPKVDTKSQKTCLENVAFLVNAVECYQNPFISRINLRVEITNGF
jgi:hypothetical protein